jgi:Uma2 family endonuclease
MVQSVPQEVRVERPDSTTKLTYADYLRFPLSPSTRSRDRKLKRDLYERVGVREYWVVDPDKDFVDIHRRTAESFGEPISVPRTGTITTALLPDFELPLGRVLA